MGLIDQIIGNESGGDPNATNPSSSASGLGQFIDSTWLSTVRAHRPDLADQPDSAILGMKSDPQLSRDMTAAYAADNQATLQKNGLPVTPGTTYLAHFAGPGGAVKVLQADPSAPVGQILGQGAVKANPFMAGMTVGDLRAWADRKMGGAQTASASPASPSGGLPVPPAQAPALPAQAAPQVGAASPQSNIFAQMQPPQPPPIYYAQRRPIDLSALREALSRPPFFSSQG